MERIRPRSMAKYVLGLFLNLGIGLVFGFLFFLVKGILTGEVSGYDFFPALTGGMAFTGYFALNLYVLVFTYRLSMDINAVCEGDGLESESFLPACLLGLVTGGIYILYWIYKLAKRLRANTPRYGFKMPETGKEILVLHIASLGLISTYELIKNLNRAALVYNQTGPAAVVGGVQG